MQVTSKFITFLDYLHLEPSNNPNFCLELFEELEKSLLTFAAFEPYYLQITQIKARYVAQIRQTPSITTISMDLAQYLNTMKDELYCVFNAFKQYLQSS